MLPTSLPLTAGSSAGSAFRRAFLEHYRSIRRFVEERDIGVALIAVHESGELCGRAWVSARLGGVSTAVVGRHPSVDLYLSRDASLSNRHLALVIEPLESWEPEELRFRLLDLRTGSAMWTEDGERVEAIVAEGPAFVRVGQYRIMAFQTGGASWPRDADDAWEVLPERIFVDEREAEPDQWQRHAVRAAARGKITLLPGALGSNEDPRAGQPIGTLSIRSRNGAIKRTITRAEARRGVLLGREPRCDFSGLLAILQVSRVHVMIAQIGGRTHAIDTGSLAGIRCEGELVRSLELDRERRFTLGTDLVELSWTPFVLH